ncbi:MAG: hypothetical protein II661_01200, partial [Bacteroidales bacterium]|nr:hypothetical protein [Bacteroidales bacterium]
LQVNVMNQHDWRKCPATVALLKRILLSKGRYTCYDEVASTPSRYSKQVREFLYLNDTAPTTPEDYVLGQAFLNRTLDIGDVRIASMGNVLEKLRVNGIPEVKFEQFYDCAVRIKKKEYAAS